MLTSIKPEKMNIKVFEEGFLAALKDEHRAEVPLFNQTVESWSFTGTPVFDKEISRTATRMQVITGPVGGDLAVKKWLWLNSGTRVRHALMSSNWRSKTSPGTLFSGGGAGRVVRVSKRVRRPGIKARGWTIIIARNRQKPFAILVGNHIGGVSTRAF